MTKINAFHLARIGGLGLAFGISQIGKAEALQPLPNIEVKSWYLGDALQVHRFTKKGEFAPFYSDKISAEQHARWKSANDLAKDSLIEVKQRADDHYRKLVGLATQKSNSACQNKSALQELKKDSDDLIPLAESGQSNLRNINQVVTRRVPDKVFNSLDDIQPAVLSYDDTVKDLSSLESQYGKIAADFKKLSDSLQKNIESSAAACAAPPATSPSDKAVKERTGLEPVTASASSSPGTFMSPSPNHSSYPNSEGSALRAAAYEQGLRDASYSSANPWSNPMNPMMNPMMNPYMQQPPQNNAGSSSQPKESPSDSGGSGKGGSEPPARQPAAMAQSSSSPFNMLEYLGLRNNPNASAGKASSSSSSAEASVAEASPRSGQRGQSAAAVESIADGAAACPPSKTYDFANGNCF